MSGRTGKMTAEALAARGPRHVLARVGEAYVIYREDQPPPNRGSVISKSFTLGYLKKIQKAYQTGI